MQPHLLVIINNYNYFSFIIIYPTHSLQAKLRTLRDYVNDLQSSYDELLDTFGELETAAKDKIKTLEDKLAKALNSPMVKGQQRQPDNAIIIFLNYRSHYYMHMYKYMCICTCTCNSIHYYCVIIFKSFLEGQ